MKTKEKKKVVGKFDYAYACKHSVRFNPTDDKTRKISGAFYLGKEHVEALGNPKTLELTIEAV
ncbi:MAG: hypothetical protein CMB80_02275 [Flammeovirgaceae bacterium]|nr:hypothetical protein [Flammeovirgaceae bacterium]